VHVKKIPSPLAAVYPVLKDPQDIDKEEEEEELPTSAGSEDDVG